MKKKIAISSVFLALFLAGCVHPPGRQSTPSASPTNKSKACQHGQNCKMKSNMMMNDSSDMMHMSMMNSNMLSVAPEGLAFEKINLTLPRNQQVGTLAFYPSNPVGYPVQAGSSFLPEANTIGALKKMLVSYINEGALANGREGYLPITINDIEIYGGPFLNTVNSFTDAKVLEAQDNGEPYRVKINLSSVNRTNIVQSIVEGNFTIYKPR